MSVEKQRFWQIRLVSDLRGENIMEQQFIIEIAKEEEMKFLYKKIKEYNSEKISLLKDQKVERTCKVIKDSEGTVIAGAISNIFHNLKAAELDILWVKEEYRRHRYGTMLIKAVEKEVFEKGGSLMYLGTLGFQAKDFYEKKGYGVFAVLEECALNNKCYFMRKKLNSCNVELKTNEIVEEGTANDARFIDDNIVAFNEQQLPHTNKQPFYDIDKVIKDSEGNVIAGITTTVFQWNELHIHGMWTNEEFSGENLQSKLINNIEKELKDYGGHVIWLETYLSEAKDLYVKNGYEVYGELDDYSVNCKAYYLKKII